MPDGIGQQLLHDAVNGDLRLLRHRFFDAEGLVVDTYRLCHNTLANVSECSLEAKLQQGFRHHIAGYAAQLTDGMIELADDLMEVTLLGFRSSRPEFREV